LPERKLAEFCDRLLRPGLLHRRTGTPDFGERKGLGLAVKLHVDELATSAGRRWPGTRSGLCDHLIYANDEGYGRWRNAVWWPSCCRHLLRLKVQQHAPAQKNDPGVCGLPSPPILIPAPVTAFDAVILHDHSPALPHHRRTGDHCRHPERGRSHSQRPHPGIARTDKQMTAWF